MTNHSSSAMTGAFSNKPDALFVNGFISASIVYTLLFNYLDEGNRTAIAGVLGIAVMARSLISWPNPASVASTFLFLAFLAIPVFYFLFRMDPRDQNGTEYATLLVRMGTCLAILLVLTHSPRVASVRLLVLSAIAITLVAVFVAATGELTVYAESIRPASFTGGHEGVHSTGYVLTAVLLGTIHLWRCAWLSASHMLLLATPLTVLVLLFQVRTTWTMVLVFALSALLFELRKRDKRGTWIAPALFLTAGLLTWAVSLDGHYSEFSSGRTAAYAERIEMILNRSLFELLFGTGAGSEMIINSVWWWEAKNSHNDFLDITIETGIVGLALLSAMLIIIGSRLDRLQTPLFVAFVTSSAISNGLLGRPFIAVLLLAFLLVPPRCPLMQEAAAPTAFALTVRET